MLINRRLFVNLPTLAKHCLISNDRSGHWLHRYSVHLRQVDKALNLSLLIQIWCAREDLIPPRDFTPQGSASTNSATYAKRRLSKSQQPAPRYAGRVHLRDFFEEKKLDF